MPRPSKLSADQLAEVCAMISRKHSAPSWQGVADLILAEFGIKLNIKSLQANATIKQAYDKKRTHEREKKEAQKRAYIKRRSKAEKDIEEHNAYIAQVAEYAKQLTEKARLLNLPLANLPPEIDLKPIAEKSDG